MSKGAVEATRDTKEQAECQQHTRAPAAKGLPIEGSRVPLKLIIELSDFRRLAGSTKICVVTVQYREK